MRRAVCVRHHAPSAAPGHPEGAAPPPAPRRGLPPGAGAAATAGPVGGVAFTPVTAPHADGGEGEDDGAALHPDGLGFPEPRDGTCSA